MKSKSIWNVRVPYGIGEVVSPRTVTYSVTCQEWFIQGPCASRTLPTICVQRCKVAHVSLHASSGRLGQASFIASPRFHGHGSGPGARHFQAASTSAADPLAADTRKGRHIEPPMATHSG